MFHQLHFAPAEDRKCWNWIPGSKPLEPCFTNQKKMIVQNVVNQLEKLDNNNMSLIMIAAASKLFIQTFEDLGEEGLITPESLVVDIVSEIESRQTKKTERMKAQLTKLIEGKLGGYKR
jgi:hypothetical protein